MKAITLSRLALHILAETSPSVFKKKEDKPHSAWEETIITDKIIGFVENNVKIIDAHPYDTSHQVPVVMIRTVDGSEIHYIQSQSFIDWRNEVRK